MSQFSNPASGTQADIDGYIQGILGALGDRDPFDVQEKHADRIDAAIHGLSDADLRRPEAPGKWSIAQVLNHLVDTEIVTAWRTRMIVAEDSPPIQSYDQDLWAARLRYDGGDPLVLLDELRVLRRRNLRLYRALSSDEWARYGMHQERGRETAERLFRMIAGHDLIHFKQIERIKAALGS